ncbi:hypothetical protein BVC80_1465g2 [Macleaya cordata]|uniref:Polyadenylate-binding protein 1-B-binding protein n=1 Tax=Macleaya cordata TaxID=56857 RepID=A0A200PUV2_MACCD|nr:hypothetical protein BVC80_1465g2 [Macleaya cordata]
MDREPEELQFMGFYGIYREAYKIIVSWRKIFLQITLSFILPLSFIYLAQMEISELLFEKIIHNEHTLQRTRTGSPMHNRIHDRISSERATYWTFKAIYHIFLLILSLLSTSAVVYTIACIYTSKEITFKKVMSVVPKVWKRLMITFLWNFFILFLYNFFAILLLILLVITVGLYENQIAFILLLVVLIICYFIGFVYISVIWHLASVISVLEDSYGFKAFKKSKALIKGKMWIASAIFIKLQGSFFVVLMAFQSLVVHGNSLGAAGKVSFGIFCFLLLSILIHFALVIQTIVYFVCKSYHHENIDKSCLAEHLEVYYLGDYLPLIRDKDVQLEQFDV